MCAANICVHEAEAHMLVQHLAILFAKFNQPSHIKGAKAGQWRLALAFMPTTPGLMCRFGRFGRAKMILSLASLGQS